MQCKTSGSFLPAGTVEPAELERQRQLIFKEPVIASVLNGMLNFSIILNRSRQIIFYNKVVGDFMAAHGIDEIIGRKPGNLAGCVHATETAGGCGTTEACSRCGSAQSLLQGLNGKSVVHECRIMSRKIGEDLDLNISVKPFKYEGEDFLLMSLVDISAEKRREALDRLFFHDILNTAGGLSGLISLIDCSNTEETKRYVNLVSQASDRLIEQILSQKDLSAAERGDLHIKTAEIVGSELLREITDLFNAHEVAKNKEIVVNPVSEAVHFRSDKALLFRIIGNMIKNALEAESPGAKVTLCCKEISNVVVFTVHNPAQMPEDVRHQIFQRSFSTKGAGRGLGTYSIRLLTEKYLKGKASFSTGPDGTVFKAEYPLLLL